MSVGVFTSNRDGYPGSRVFPSRIQDPGVAPDLRSGFVPSPIPDPDPVRPGVKKALDLGSWSRIRNISLHLRKVLLTCLGAEMCAKPAVSCSMILSWSAARRGRSQKFADWRVGGAAWSLSTQQRATATCLKASRARFRGPWARQSINQRKIT
jgi:hypothetical protein